MQNTDTYMWNYISRFFQSTEKLARKRLFNSPFIPLTIGVGTVFYLTIDIISLGI